ncbi:phosphoribosylglycinamide formyltransferase [Parasphingorhabdus cellanae]|uniref:Phosphoribosylglycinamide formyltransferase n=1 Tax=Parasphingorhabdus cellanae TaxID=2806553 RepID=A0ABX7T8L4_9SPHN|nr:phosphoribosylglycinamide formyltransferase [Parasphingorhabdus cellanae]QTD56822.1 phosphoribosylglycinamide formyltransferase [Parasphingorhabdus cellanae]
MKERAKVAVLISGRGSNMAALVYAAKADDCSYEIVLVASNDPAAPGLKLAQAEGIDTFAHPHKGLKRLEHDQIIHEAVTSAGAEYIALAGYMRILSDDFVSRWNDHMLNIHPSLLPKYKGLDTYQRALDAGDTHAGCSVHLVTPELDDGPVLAQTAVAILPNDTASILADRVLIAEHQLYPATLAKYVSRQEDPDWILDQVRTRALALEETHERPSFGTPGWRVGSEKTGKYFAYFSRRHFGETGTSIFVKTSGLDEQGALLDADPDLYFSPKFYGKSGWIAIRLDTGRTDWEHVTDSLRKSWRMVAPKRLTRFMDIADDF